MIGAGSNTATCHCGRAATDTEYAPNLGDYCDDCSLARCDIISAVDCPHYRPVVPMSDDDLPDLTYEAPPGTELVGFYCFRAGGHLCESSCKSDSVPLFAQIGWAAHVRESINEAD